MLKLCIKIFLLYWLISFPVFAAEKICSYSTYKWNTHLKKVVEFKQVQHSYSQLQDFEIDRKTGCTVCEEDQVSISVVGLPSFKVCKYFASNIENTLNQLIANQQPIFKIVAYRVGMTRGKADDQGNRTQFSNHSFGIALDINQDQNGLYDQCLKFNLQCRLRKGGVWNPRQKGSLTLNSPLVKSLKSIGFKWGGEIKGWQKDFMHFSPTGY